MEISSRTWLGNPQQTGRLNGTIMGNYGTMMGKTPYINGGL